MRKIVKRLALYLLGLMLMALGITLLNLSDLGTTPLSSIPYVLSRLLSGSALFTFGRLTLLFHTACALAQVAAHRRVTAQILLQIPLAVVFSALLDLFGSLLSLPAPPLALRLALCAAGVALSALGIVLIVRAGLMLPAPDALLHAVSERTGRPLSQVKIAGDVLWVAVAALLSLALLLSRGTAGFWPLLSGCFGGRLAVGVGTLIAMYFTGRLVGVFRRLPFLKADAG